LEDQTKVLFLTLTAEAAAEIPFPTLAEQVINGLVVSYRVNAGLLRAVTRAFLSYLGVQRKPNRLGPQVLPP
jgi:hypothetical protein